MQPEYQTRNAWCDDCHGYTHMPWCSEYVEPLTDLQRAVIEHDDDMARLDRNTLASEQPTSAAGSETGLNDYECDACGKRRPKDEMRGRNFSAGVEGLFCHECRHGKDCKCMGDTVDDQQHAAQLRFLGNRAEELSSLLVRMTTERDGLYKQNERLRYSIKIALDKVFNDGKRAGWVEIQQSAIDELYAALSHAEQREGS